MTGSEFELPQSPVEVPAPSPRTEPGPGNEPQRPAPGPGREPIPEEIPPGNEPAAPQPVEVGDPPRPEFIGGMRRDAEISRTRSGPSGFGLLRA